MSQHSDYLTVAGVSESEFTIKGSRFIGVAMPCREECDIKPNLASVEVRHPDATHYCYAVLYGGVNRTEKSSDNGEPSGTAARPILSVIRGKDVTDTMVVVARYFGGTLLGTGGLVHAYTQAASDSLACASIKKMTYCSLYSVCFGYADVNAFKAKCERYCTVPPSYEYAEKVTVKAAVPAGRSDDFLHEVADATSRRASTVPLGEGYF